MPIEGGGIIKAQPLLNTDDEVDKARNHFETALNLNLDGTMFNPQSAAVLSETIKFLDDWRKKAR